MKYTVTEQVIRVLGKLWMPTGSGAAELILSDYEMENLLPEDGSAPTREDVVSWLTVNTHDFSGITDFEVDFTLPEPIGQVNIPWENEDSEIVYWEMPQ